MSREVPMDSGKLRHPERPKVDLQPSGCIDLIYMRRRAFLPVSESARFPEHLSATLLCLPPAHKRSKRWLSDEAFENRRIEILLNKTGVCIGYRATIQQGHRPTVKRHSKSFRADDFDGNLEEALQQARLWRDAKEQELGIQPGHLRSKAAEKPWSGISLIVSKSQDGRSYWGSNREVGKQALRAYIGKRSYKEAYHDLITRIADRDGIPLPPELPAPPPPRADQYRRMTRAGLTGIPEPVRRRRTKAA